MQTLATGLPLRGLNPRPKPMKTDEKPEGLKDWHCVVIFCAFVAVVWPSAFVFLLVPCGGLWLAIKALDGDF